MKRHHPSEQTGDSSDPKRSKTSDETPQTLSSSYAQISPQMGPPQEETMEVVTQSTNEEAAEQQSLIEAIEAMAAEFKEAKFQQLMAQRRERGFNQYLADLRGANNNHEGEGWSLRNGNFHIDYNHFDNEQTKNEIHAFLDEKLGHMPWFKTPTFESPYPDAEKYFGVPIKTLGGNGANKAVDPIMLIQSTSGEVSVLSGLRPVCNEYCLPGGMNEAGVMNTCINELLEECFSGALFEAESRSAAALNAKDLANTTLIAKIQELCPPTVSLELNTDSGDKTSIIQSAINQIQHSTALEEGRKTPLVAHLRCELYKSFLPEQYENFANFVKARTTTTLDTIQNISDPRNTDAAYMITKPLPAFVKEEEFADLAEDCALNIKAGDDIGNVRFRNIDVFCGNILSTGTAPEDTVQGSFSGHASEVLDAVALGVKNHSLEWNPRLEQQLATIQAQALNVTQELEEDTSMAPSV